MLCHVGTEGGIHAKTHVIRGSGRSLARGDLCRVQHAAAAARRRVAEAGRWTSRDSRSFAPLPASVPGPQGAASEEMITLGRMLYYEPRLSKSQTISCNSCHDLAQYGVDGQPTSDGHKGQTGTRNSPTVYNAAAHFVQFWDGRAPDVEEQAKGPVLNPVEMAMPAEPVVVTGARIDAGVRGPVQEVVPQRQEARDLRQHGEGHRRLRAEADDALAMGRAAERRPERVDARGDAGAEDVPGRGLPVVPLGRPAGRHVLPAAGRREAVPGHDGSRAVRRDQERGRQGRLQGAVAPQHREDRRRTTTTAR